MRLIEIELQKILHPSFERDEMKLAFVFNVFGAVIINNLNKNLELSLDDKMVKMCEECGKRIVNTNGKRNYCEKCAKEIDRKKAKERMKLSYKLSSICNTVQT